MIRGLIVYGIKYPKNLVRLDFLVIVLILY